jgi:hypothetical protein
LPKSRKVPPKSRGIPPKSRKVPRESDGKARRSCVYPRKVIVSKELGWGVAEDPRKRGTGDGDASIRQR